VAIIPRGNDLCFVPEAVHGAAAGRTGRARRDQSAGEAAGPDVASSGALCPACHAQRRLCPARSEDYETEAEHGLYIKCLGYEAS
jgi:hypothetical protein